jgi:hypothetical protein
LGVLRLETFEEFDASGGVLENGPLMSSLSEDAAVIESSVCVRDELDVEPPV